MFLNANPQGLCKKNTDASEMDEGKEARSEFIKTSGNPSELLELEEKGFHKVALLVEPPVDEPRVGIIFPWRDTEIRIVVGDELTKLPLAVGPVSENSRPLKPIWPISFSATVMSGVFPVVSRIAMGLPKASTAA